MLFTILQIFLIYDEKSRASLTLEVFLSHSKCLSTHLPATIVIYCYILL